jgi:heptosyltransferase-2
VTSPESVLVCRLSALGDVVLALPVVDALRARYPAARLEFLAREPHGRILQGVSALDALHLWPGPGEKLAPAVTGTRWDLVVDLSVSGRSRRLLARVPAVRRLRARKQTLRRFAFVRLRRLGATAEGIDPAVDRMFAALAPLGIRREGRRPRFQGPDPPADGPVLLAPGAGRATKCWPVERFAEIAREVVADGGCVLALGSVRERVLLEAVVEGLDPSRAEAIACEDPAELPRIAGRCPLALANDSGLAHVAEAAGARVVALFGPTHPGLGFGPLGSGSVALHLGLPCSPCDPHGPTVCPKGHHRCLQDLRVEDVRREMRAAAAGRVE